jgi:hypothetical protein
MKVPLFFLLFAVGIHLSARSSVAVDPDPCAASNILIVDGLAFNVRPYPSTGRNTIQQIRHVLETASFRSQSFELIDEGKSGNLVDEITEKISKIHPRVIIIHYSSFSSGTQQTQNTKFFRFLSKVDKALNTDTRYIIHSRAFLNKEASLEEVVNRSSLGSKARGRISLIYIKAHTPKLIENNGGKELVSLIRSITQPWQSPECGCAEDAGRDRPGAGEADPGVGGHDREAGYHSGLAP